MIYNPLEEYQNKFKELHFQNTNAFFERLVKQSKVNIEENRETVRQYNLYKENIVKLKRKLTWFKVLRVLLCITIVLIPLVILKTNPRIKELKEEIEQSDQKAEELLNQAKSQMQPLNQLFTDRDALNLITQTVPMLSFDLHFSAKQEVDMIINYDFGGTGSAEQSTFDLLAGQYNENPFVFENKLVHTMGTQVYHGQKTIRWTETYRDSNGRLQTRTRTQTLHASVTKPKPFFNTQVVLNYGSQGGPELCFSRDATHLDRKSDKEIKRHIKKGERMLKKKTDKAISSSGEFTSMSNTEFEVLFDALDRTHEVQFRTLFTPLAQTNMVDLILSNEGYGDDFHFIKAYRTNKIISNHSQGRLMNLLPDHYISYSFDIIQECFINKNVEFFKAVYFDFAPLWAIPMYQERPVHSLKPIPEFNQLYSQKECEALSNAIARRFVVHPNTKTEAIIKSDFIKSNGSVDQICVTAHSYDIAPRVEMVMVYGGDGRYHNVPVPWDEYIPLKAQNDFFVTALDTAKNESIVAIRNGLCAYIK